MRCVIVMLVLCIGAGTGDAHPRKSWRDGCPAGSVHAYAGTDRHWLGAAPQPDSALVPSRALVGGTLGYYLASGNGARARTITQQLRLHQNIPVSTAYSLGLTGTLPWSRRRAGDAANMAPSQWGNGSVGMAVRGHILYSEFDRQEGDEDGNTPIIAGLRVAWAAEVTQAAQIPGVDHDDNDAVQLEAFSPFETHLFAPNGVGFLPGPSVTALELRAEAVGCYAPFVHVRLSATFEEDESDGRVLVLPQTAAIGMYVSDRIALMFQYGVMVRAARFASVYGVDAIHRFRFGFERSGDYLSVGGSIDLFRGAQRLEGTILNLYVSINWDRG